MLTYLRLAVLALLLAAPLVAHADQGRAPSPFRVRFQQLAADPAHGNQITSGSIREAYVGLRLEQRGTLPAPIRRDPSGAAEFVDGRGVTWDVKAFNSHWSVEEGGFQIQRVEHKLAQEIGAGQRLILDLRNVSDAHRKDLASLVRAKGWGKHVAWYPAQPATTP